MYFTSGMFVLFLALLVAGYYVIFRRWQWQFLLCASLVFYAFSGWDNLIYLGATIVSTFLAGRYMGGVQASLLHTLEEGKDTFSTAEAKALRAEAKRRRKRALVACLLLNLGILSVVKYANFAIGNINSFLDLLGVNGSLGFLGLLLPMGISFYTFQAMGYLIDVYRSKKPDAAERSIFRFALFASFFPQMVQGPISRYGDLSKTLYQSRRFDSQIFGEGLLRVLWGFFKKLVVADRLLGAVRALTAAPDAYGGAYVLWAVLLYAVVLYADFTGGIDIAIGAAKMLGITVAENFDRPFYSKSIAEYWRRWHITMGTWFKDYLFYPLSASKPMLALIKPSKRIFGEKNGVRVPVYLTTLILWFATGLWHGASWNFIVWGLVNGVVIIISQELTPAYRKFHARFSWAKRGFYGAFQVIRTFLLMCFIRSFDIYPGVGATFSAFGSMFADFARNATDFSGLMELGPSLGDYIVAAVGVAMMIAAGAVKSRFYGNRAMSGTLLAVCAMALFFSVLVFGRYGFGYDANQFIYNQF